MSEPLRPSSTTPAEFVTPGHLLAAIVDSSDDAIVSKNLSGIITSWNQGAERIFGYTAQEAIGQSILMIIPQERRDEEQHIIERIKKGERVDHFDTVRRRKDGTPVDVSLTISPIKNNKGQVVGASKIARDITERRRNEQEISRYRNKLEIINSIGVSLGAERKLEKLVQEITDAGRELCGAGFAAFFYNVVDAAGESYTLYTLSGAPREAFEKFGMPRNTPIFAPTFAGEGVVRIADVKEDPRYGQMAPHHGMPAGHLPVRSYMAVPVTSRTGAVIGGLFFGHPQPGIFTEDSERILVALAAQAAVAIDNARLYDVLQRELEQQRVTQQALRESEALSRSVLNNTGDCVKVLDLDGAIIYMNPPGLAAFDLDSFEPIMGRLWADFWPEGMRETVRHSVRDAAAGISSRFTGACPTTRGALKWWDVIVTPVYDSEGKVSRLTATSRDVTDQRKASEELVVAKGEAERQSRMKDEFLATLSHELRTPLQSVLGWAEVLRGGPGDPDEWRQGLDVITRNAHAQTRIIEDLLDMSRILAGKVRLEVQKVRLDNVLEAAIETVRPTAETKGIRLNSVLDSKTQPIVGDPNRLQQVFWNLLSNAIKFTPRHGKVHVTLERVNSHLEVSIIDTGSGIAPEFLPYVFDRFRQADASTTRHHGGLGLGLAIVKHLTELHGGTVKVKSPGPGKGTTFIVTLPLAPVQIEPAEDVPRRPEEPPDAPIHIPTVKLDGVSILVVDDEEDARGLLCKILTRSGAKVRVAGSAREALQLFQQMPPQVLISDIGMPGEDGYSLIRSIRSLAAAEGGRIPALALSAYTRKEDRIRSLAAGFQMHLAKPAEPMELLAVVLSLAHRGGEGK
jgi:PAS domain S-box-containing protein